MRRTYPHLPDNQIATRIGVSASTVQMACKKAGLISRDGSRRARVKDADLPRISNLCVAIGSVMTDYHRTSGSSYAEVGPSMIINRMLTGLHDFTTLELERIAAWMNTPVSELMRSAELRLITFSGIGSPPKP